MNHWKEKDLPTRGWAYGEVVDLFETGDVHGNGAAQINTHCQMCGEKQIRFVHVLHHRDCNHAMRVGCVCAGKMTGDTNGAQSRERKQKSRSNLQKKWSKLPQWKDKSIASFLDKTKNGKKVEIMLINLGDGWKVSLKTDHTTHSIPTSKSSSGFPCRASAKSAAFDKFWELTEKSGSS